MTKKEASDKQEKLIAKLLGWKQVTGSGSRNNYPGDVSGEEWLGECKTHVDEHRVVFKEDVWHKISEEASSRFKYPAYFSDNGSQFEIFTWVIIRERELPSDYKIVDITDSVKSSFSFNADDPFYSNMSRDNVVYRFAFNTKSNELYTKRDKLLLMKLRTFKEIVLC